MTYPTYTYPGCVFEERYLRTLENLAAIDEIRNVYSVDFILRSQPEVMP